MRNLNEIKQRDKDIEKRMRKHGYAEQMHHYTSIPALYGILENKELWFGNTATMNDKLEVVGFLNSLEKELQQELSVSKHQMCKEFFEHARGRLLAEYPFALCFSKLSDNAAQWERYADDAKGVCIVFNTRKLIAALYTIDILFCEVFYDSKVREHQIYKMLYEYFIDGNETQTFLEDNVLSCGYIHKHKSFSTECEVRAVTLWDRIPKHSHICYECIGDQVKKVLKVDLEQMCLERAVDFEDMIEKIVIGPRSKQSKYELEEYIKSIGLQKLATKVEISECPLR